MIIQQALPLPSLKCTEAAKICCKKFCNCSGRARRSEFWYFVLLLRASHQDQQVEWALD